MLPDKYYRYPRFTREKNWSMPFKNHLKSLLYPTSHAWVCILSCFITSEILQRCCCPLPVLINNVLIPTREGVLLSPASRWPPSESLVKSVPRTTLGRTSLGRLYRTHSLSQRFATVVIWGTHSQQRKLKEWGKKKETEENKFNVVREQQRPQLIWFKVLGLEGLLRCIRNRGEGATHTCTSEQLMDVGNPWLERAKPWANQLHWKGKRFKGMSSALGC